MKLSISTTLFYGNHIFDVLPNLRGLPIDGIELRMKEAQFDFNEDQQIKELKRIAKKEKVNIISLHVPSDIDLCDSDEWNRVRSVREVQKGIVIANRIGAEFVVIHPGERRIDEKVQMEMLRLSLDEIVQFAKDWEIQVLAENTQPGKIGDIPEEIAKILNWYDTPRPGWCFDTSHMNLCGITMGKALDVLGEDLVEVHVSDNMGKSDDHTLPGTGTIDWDDFLESIHRIRYNGILCYELMPEEDYIPVVERICEIYEGWTNRVSEDR
jgi:sugar phosphate isomerase/epimerase